nr:hypothetical protein [Deltaproteobacteria bacterium]
MRGSAASRRSSVRARVAARASCAGERIPRCARMAWMSAWAAGWVRSAVSKNSAAAGKSPLAKARWPCS